MALIAGPTASGKSALAVRLAKSIEARGGSAVVINADSAQVYADLRVLSARPTEEEMEGIPHRIFGTWDGSVACSAADWSKSARDEIARAHAEGAYPILVGGTGLYFRTLLDGIAPIPPIDPAIRDEVRALSQEDARAALEAEDPLAATRLAPRDTARTTRALEVIRSTGRPITDWQGARSGGIAGEIGLHPLVLMPERPWLYARCDLRFGAMLENGARQEVAALLERRLSEDLPVMRAIGVREVARLLEGQASFEETVEAGCLATRRYAKRQFTWFRHQAPADWPRIESENYGNTEIDELFFRFLS